jgi:EAL domain-containing protein (putative c-di-GMP-specific phosphodiesterase class I)
MYLANAEGRNQVVVYTDGVAERLRDKAELARDLATALADDQFEVHYQPVVVDSTGGLDAVEALLRWHHPVRGRVAPSDFIPIAEQSGAIRKIGIWVLRTAAEQVAAWRRTVPGCAHLRLAVNLSPRQLVDPNLINVVAEALMHSQLPATALVLEVTESMLLDDIDHARQQLGRLRALGIRIAIDDFGTGYSSLSYLSTLPVDELKIDQSFVRNIEDNAGSRGLVKAIIDMAHTLGLTTVAEGVEEQGQRAILSELGCARAQGYLFARPLPVEEFAVYATRRRLRSVEVA